MRVIVAILLISISATTAKTIFNSSYDAFRLTNVHKFNSNDSLVLWQPNRKLKWDDYKGIPDTNSSYMALTYTTVEITPRNYNESTVEYSISCSFESNLSWSKNKLSNELLKHEQIHFDIAELTIRKMRKKFINYRFLNLEDAGEKILKFADEAREERRKLNFDYDEKTNHGINITEQKKWQSYIAFELKKYSKYSYSIVKMKKK